MCLRLRHPLLGVVAYLTLMTVEATSAGAILFRDTRGEREYFCS